MSKVIRQKSASPTFNHPRLRIDSFEQDFVPWSHSGHRSQLPGSISIGSAVLHSTGWAKKVIPLVQCNICTIGITFLAHPVHPCDQHRHTDTQTTLRVTLGRMYATTSTSLVVCWLFESLLMTPTASHARCAIVEPTSTMRVQKLCRYIAE